jgi:glycine/D-amino acid oxidase-like deaminating enzyme
MSKLRVARPLWLDRASSRRRSRYPAMRGDLTADVVIVGGGISGAAAAWTFASAGVRVVLVERALVGRGSTAASTALLMQEPDKDFHELAARYGRAAARRMWQLSHAATRDFIRTLRRLHIACDLTELDSVYYTTDDAAAVLLRREYRLRRAAGIECTWLGRSRLRRRTGIDGTGGIRTPGNGQADPHRACLGLLRAAVRRGARVFERSPVRRIDTSGEGVTVVTAAGAIRANRAIVATGYATPEFKPLGARFSMKHTYVVATRRLGARTRAALGLGDAMLWDTDRPYHYARWTPDRRLLLGGGDRPRLAERQRRRALREGADVVFEHFARLYPALRDVRLDYAWEGLFATTPDGLPYIGPHRRYPKHLFALGYGGNGMTFGFLAARLLLDWYNGRDGADHRLFAFNRQTAARFTQTTRRTQR